jgi:hypothetical protein
LLLGYQSITDEREFLSEWMSRIYRFDQKAREYGTSDCHTEYNDDSDEGSEKELFSNCPVCGNGYIICKKIEDLIKDVFSHPFIPLSHPPRAGGNSFTPPRTLNEISISSQLKIDDDINSSVTPSRNSSVAYSDSSSLHHCELPSVDGVLTDQITSSDVERSFNPSERLSENADTAAERGTLQDKEICKVISKPQSRESILIPKPPSMEKGKRNLVKEKTASAVTTVIPVSGDRKLSLLEFYPNFCMLFPATYNQLGTR